MKYENLSNGSTDGIVLFYVRDKVQYPVMLSQEQADSLDMLIRMAIGEKLTVDFNQPMGRVKSLIE